MDEYFVRQPIFKKNLIVCGYYLNIGAKTRRMILTDPITETEESSVQMDGVNVLSDNMMTFLDFSLNLLDGEIRLLSNEKDSVKTVIVFGKGMTVTREQCKAMRSFGYITLLNFTHVIKNPVLADYADIIQIEFTFASPTAQISLVKQYKNRVIFLASRIETWDDFEKAKKMGYELFQGSFFLRPTVSPNHKEIKSLDTSLVSVLNELSLPDPNFHTISELIEHDLGLSYRLLRLVNSAYMAPRYKISTIYQALTYLGLREMYQWISMLVLNGMKSEENSELIKMSLLRGKLMALIAQKMRLPYTGTEPFFVGMFSLIDVILKKEMKDLLPALPLTADVKDTLSGRHNDLTRILSFVIDYEQAKWRKIEDKYPFNLIKPEDMVSFYFEALKWSKYDT